MKTRFDPDLPWHVVSYRTGQLIAAFAVESRARDYCRMLNDGRRVWKVHWKAPGS